MKDRSLVAGLLVISLLLLSATLVVAQPDEFRIIYDGNGGECQVEDPNVYHEGDSAEVLFWPEPSMPGHIFVGWSTDPGSEYPEFDASLDTDRVDIVDGDVTLYAVYSENLYLAQPGSTFDYRVTETWKNFPDYICVIEVTATVLENDGTDIVYSVEGTQYVRDGDAEETTPVELTFDTAEDYWGYNNGELALIEERTEWFEFRGGPVFGYIAEYDGVEYYETCTDWFGYYDSILYKSEFENNRDDGDVFRNVTELIGFSIIC